MPSGVGNHKKACKKRLDATLQQDQFVADLLAEPQRTFHVPAVGARPIDVRLGSLPAPRFIAPWQMDSHASGSSPNDLDPPGHDR